MSNTEQKFLKELDDKLWKDAEKLRVNLYPVLGVLDYYREASVFWVSNAARWNTLKEFAFGNGIGPMEIYYSIRIVDFDRGSIRRTVIQ